jgi:hypothetical protein
MKPMIISAMVAGVQAGRIIAVAFISPVPSVAGQPPRGCLEIEMVTVGKPFKAARAKTGQGIESEPQNRRGRSQPFRRPRDVVHLPGYFVAKDLKTGWFPAPSLLVSGQMASHHFDQINRS